MVATQPGSSAPTAGSGWSPRHADEAIGRPFVYRFGVAASPLEPWIGVLRLGDERRGAR